MLTYYHLLIKTYFAVLLILCLYCVLLEGMFLRCLSAALVRLFIQGHTCTHTDTHLIDCFTWNYKFMIY